MWPGAIALIYSVKNIQNDVHQKIIIDEKSQLNRLVWGSLTLVPIIYSPHNQSFPTMHGEIEWTVPY